MDGLWRWGRERLASAWDRVPSRLAHAFEHLRDRNILLAGSSLAFYGLVSVFPLLVIAFSLVSAVAGQDTLTEFTRTTAQRGAVGVGAVLGGLTSNAPTLTWVTVLAALWPATAYGAGLRRALAHTSTAGERLSGLRGRLLGLSLVLVLPVLVLAGVPLLFLVVQFIDDGASGVLLGWGLGFLTVVTIGSLLTTIVYRVFSPDGMAFRHALAAATIVSTITALFTVGFVVYLSVGDVEERFGGGTVATVVLMGVWLFVANVLLLAGHHAAIEMGEGD